MRNPLEAFQDGDLANFVVIFSLCAFLGWVLEVLYRSFTQKCFVNAGFLIGPFLPIYGLGAFFVLLMDACVHNYPLVLQLLIYGVVLTIIEYAIGAFSERIFGLMLWDYTENRFNLHGRVCLQYSILWALLALGFQKIMYPLIAGVPEQLRAYSMPLIASALVLYFVIDFAFSARVLGKFVARLSRIHLRHVHFNISEMGRLRKTYERLLVAFPNLKGYLEASFQNGFKNRFDQKVTALHQRFFAFVEARHPRGEEFRVIVRDVVNNPEFQRLKEFRHHNDSIYEHVMRVSFRAYKIGKYLNMDYRAIARGGLLHDFFLYDWHNHDWPDLGKEKFHGFAHPKIALRNAERNFELSTVERDIIVKHMWPLTLRPPRFWESLLVSLVDKQVAFSEYWEEYQAHRKNRKHASKKEGLAI